MLEFRNDYYITAECDCGCHQEFHCKINHTPAKFTAGGLLINGNQLLSFLNRAQEELFLREDAGNA